MRLAGVPPYQPGSTQHCRCAGFRNVDIFVSTLAMTMQPTSQLRWRSAFRGSLPQAFPKCLGYENHSPPQMSRSRKEFLHLMIDYTVIGVKDG